MHEMSLALNILDIASEESDRRGGVMIRAIHIRLGPLAGVVQEALISAFELARDGSPFGQCRLVIEAVRVTVNCPTCNAVRPVDSIQMLCCSTCGTLTGRVASGNELEITAMEIELPENRQPISPSGEEYESRSAPAASRGAT